MYQSHAFTVCFVYITFTILTGAQLQTEFLHLIQTTKEPSGSNLDELQIRFWRSHFEMTSTTDRMDATNGCRIEFDIPVVVGDVPDGDQDVVQLTCEDFSVS